MSSMELDQAIEDLRYASVGDHWWQLETDEFADTLRRVQEAAWDEGKNQPDILSVVNPYSLDNS